METAPTNQNSSIASRRLNFLSDLPRAALAIGAVLTITWIAFLGYEIVRLLEAVL
jgi:hypothetical protein